MKKITLLLSLSIYCTLSLAQSDDLRRIKTKIEAFSQALMDGDTISISQAYTSDGKILPNGSPILIGEQLKEYWNRGIRNGQTYFHHKVMPEEINVLGEYAYDYGYYEGESGRSENRSKWQGKYVIIWRKESKDWKIYIDIWNSVPLNDK